MLVMSDMSYDHKALALMRIHIFGYMYVYTFTCTHTNYVLVMCDMTHSCACHDSLVITCTYLYV